MKGKIPVEKWTIKNNQTKEKIIVGALLLLGFALTYLLKSYYNFQLTTEAAGFYLGIILLVIGIGALVVMGDSQVVVDPKRRVIEMIYRNGRRTDRKVIPFDDVEHVGIIEQGDPEGGSVSYQLEVKLKDGKNIPLFAHGYYDGHFDRDVREAQLQRFNDYLSSKVSLN